MIKCLKKITYKNTDYYFRASALRTVDEYGNNISNGKIPLADGDGGVNWITLNTGVTSFGGQTGQISVGGNLDMDGNTVYVTSIPYETSADREWTRGGLKIAIIDGEPQIWQGGWLYYIKE